MKYRVLYSPTAIKDLDRVWEDVYEASQSIDVAERYVNELLDMIESKAEFPRSGAPLNYDGVFTGYYFIVFKAYLAFYRVEDQSIFVDRVLLAKSDYLQYLRPYLGF